MSAWQDGMPRDGDPFRDWLTEIAEPADAEADSWTPRVLVLRPPAVELALAWFETGDGLRELAERLGRSEGFLRICLHDWSHLWSMLVQGPAELVYFRRDRDGLDPDEAEQEALSGLLFGETALPEGARLATSGARISDRFASEPPAAFLDPYARETTFWLNPQRETQAQPAEGPKAICGIIDFGIPVAHPAFRSTPASTRIRVIWDQQAEAAGATPPSPNVIVGREVEKADIDPVLADLDPGAAFDETAAYRRLGMLNVERPSLRRGDRPLLSRATHGAAMLDIAAGADDDRPALLDAPIYAVNLPPELVARTNGFLHEPWVKSAMNWIWFRAFKDHPHALRRLVVNYSFGDYSGRHDGQDMLDSDFQRRIDRGEVGMISLPAGNGLTADIHARITRQDLVDRHGGQIELDLIVQPDDKTATFVQVWLDPDVAVDPADHFPVTVEVETPSGAVTPRQARAAGESLDLVRNGEALARIYHQIDEPAHLMAEPSAVSNPRWRWTLAIRPTESDAQGHPTAEPGLWRLRISPSAEGVAWRWLALWVERGDSIAGFPPSGRQARLDHQAHRRWTDEGWRKQRDDDDCPIKRMGTLGGNANAPAPLAAAAFRGADARRPALYSAARSDATANAQPQMSLRAEDSGARPHVLVAGVTSGSIARTNGTSAAAAAAARRVAETLVCGGASDGLAAKAVLTACARRPGTPASTAPPTPGQPAWSAKRVGAGLVEHVHGPANRREG